MRAKKRKIGKEKENLQIRKVLQLDSAERSNGTSEFVRVTSDLRR